MSTAVAVYGMSLCWLRWIVIFFFFSSRRRHTRSLCDWSSDVCSSDLSSWGLSSDDRGRRGGGGETPGARVRERRAAAGAGRGGGVREGDRARETRGRAGGDDLAPRSEQGHRGGEDPGALLPVVLGIGGVLRAAAARLLLAHGRRAAGDPQGADR